MHRSLTRQFLLALIGAVPVVASAQSPACPPTLAWSDYSYVQRTTTDGGRVAEAELRLYTNAAVYHVRFDGTPVSMIRMTSPDAQGIVLMAGPANEDPAQLAEVAMLLEFPMPNVALRGLAAPCDLADGKTRRFDGRDVLHWAAVAVEQEAVRGRITRRGLRFTYTLAWQEPLGSGHAVQRWKGIWEKTPRLPALPLSTDVRNWRVYRDNVLLRAPVTTSLSLGALLEEIGAAPAPH